MLKSIPLGIRLTFLPALAALAVGALSVLSIREVKEKTSEAREQLDPEQVKKTSEAREQLDPEQHDPEALQILKPPRKEGAIPSSTDVLKLSEAEALKLLAETPNSAAIAVLWPLPGHRDRLFELLMSKETPEEARMLLLGSFERESPKKALDAARSIVGEGTLSQGPLLLAVFEVLSRYGDESDLLRLAKRPFELHQTRTMREHYRVSLHERVHGRN